MTGRGALEEEEAHEEIRALVLTSGILEPNSSVFSDSLAPSIFLILSCLW